MRPRAPKRRPRKPFLVGLVPLAIVAAGCSDTPREPAETGLGFGALVTTTITTQPGDTSGSIDDTIDADPSDAPSDETGSTTGSAPTPRPVPIDGKGGRIEESERQAPPARRAPLDSEPFDWGTSEAWRTHPFTPLLVSPLDLDAAGVDGLSIESGEVFDARGRYGLVCNQVTPYEGAGVHVNYAGPSGALLVDVTEDDDPSAWQEYWKHLIDCPLDTPIHGLPDGFDFVDASPVGNLDISVFAAEEASVRLIIAVGAADGAVVTITAFGTNIAVDEATRLLATALSRQ